MKIELTIQEPHAVILHEAVEKLIKALCVSTSTGGRLKHAVAVEARSALLGAIPATVRERYGLGADKLPAITGKPAPAAGEQAALDVGEDPE